MVQLLHSLSIMSDGSIRTQTETPPVLPRMWMIPHDRMRYSYDKPDWRYNSALDGKAREAARLNNKSQPEVYRVLPQHGFRLNDDWLNLFCEINPELSREMALSIFGEGLAFCNGTKNVMDQCRVMGGWMVTGTPAGDKLWLKTLRVDQPVPTVAQVLADRTVWGWCVSVRPDGLIGLWWRRGLDGQDHNVRMFIVSAQPVYISLDELYSLPAGFVPGPQWMP